MDKHLPAAAIRRAWLDHSQTSAEAAAAVGLTRVQLWKRARALDLPPRPEGRRAVVGPEDEDLFSRLWRAGVARSEIAALFGCAEQTPSTTARRLGLPARTGKRKRKPISLAAYAVATAARNETAAAKAAQA